MAAADLLVPGTVSWPEGLICGVYQVLKRNGLHRLPRNAKKRTVQTQLYEKQVPGHPNGRKVSEFQNPHAQPICWFQYTAVDDATRVRAFKIYTRHTQQNAINFIDYVISKFAFRIHTVWTDNGHEFQAQFHWHLQDLGIQHVYIKPRTPRLNGKVERSHATDDMEFYQVLTYTGDVDLNRKLKEWEDYYNFHRHHGSLRGRAPYEALMDKLKNNKTLSPEV